MLHVLIVEKKKTLFFLIYRLKGRNISLELQICSNLLGGDEGRLFFSGCLLHHVVNCCFVCDQMLSWEGVASREKLRIIIFVPLKVS